MLWPRAVTKLMLVEEVAPMSRMRRDSSLRMRSRSWPQPLEWRGMRSVAGGWPGDLSFPPKKLGISWWLLESSVSEVRDDETAGPSTPFGAKCAPNFAQDDNSIYANKVERCQSVWQFNLWLRCGDGAWGRGCGGFGYGGCGAGFGEFYFAFDGGVFFDGEALG